MKLGMISVTVNALEPMLNELAVIENLQIRNYVDEGLHSLVGREGVTERGISRMAGLIATAADDGAEAILLTCTAFTPHMQELQSMSGVPIISADGAMLKQAALLEKPTLILCTFPATMEPTEIAFTQIAKQTGTNARADIVLLKEAAELMKREGRVAHDMYIAEKARDLGRLYDVVVLAQISMSTAAKLLTDVPFTVFSSPSCTVKAIETMQLPAVSGGTQ